MATESEANAADQARAKIAEGFTDFVNSFDEWQGQGVVTGFVCVAEIIGRAGIPVMAYCTGTGAIATPEMQRQGLPLHRTAGLLRAATVEVDALLVGTPKSGEDA